MLTTGSDHWDTLGQECIHHRFKKRKLALDRMREEVGIDEDRIRRNERSIVLEEKGGGDLGNIAHHCFRSSLLFFDIAIVLL
jgi:hypothetical protein